METNKHGQDRRTPKASTADVLGTEVGSSNVDPKWEKQYRALTELRRSLLDRRKELLSQASEEVTPVQRNLAEQGTDHYDRDFVLSMASSEQETLYEIEQALNRIRIGTYGVCEATGKPIDPDRLKAIPWTRFSAEAEKDLEAQGQIQRVRLGERQEVPKERPPAGED
jgi:RNA polymerase-binding transcription factor DksA